MVTKYSEEVNNVLNEKYAAVETLKATYIEKINNVLAINIPGWTVTFLNEDYLNIGKAFETYSNGQPLYTNIECYIGYGFYLNKDRKTRFEINPFTAGSFSPLEGCRLTEYFGVVGKLCLNINGVTDTLKMLADEFVELVSVLQNAITKIIDYEEEQIIAKEKAIKEAEYAKHVAEIAPFLKTAEPYEYVVINKNYVTGKFVYRKKAVDVVTTPTSERDAIIAASRLNRGYINYYKAVKATSVKVA